VKLTRPEFAAGEPTLTSDCNGVGSTRWRAPPTPRAPPGHNPTFGVLIRSPLSCRSGRGVNWPYAVFNRLPSKSQQVTFQDSSQTAS
jgi:hypothetical protein